MKTLKIWNGRGYGKYINSNIYVAAYTQKQAAELVTEACHGLQFLKYELIIQKVVGVI